MVLVATKVGVDNMNLHHTRRQMAKGKQKDLLWVYPVTTGMKIVLQVPGKKSKLLFHRIKLALDVERGVESLQLAPIEA